MKKQILFLAMFTLALIFAGTTSSNAQACAEDALHPIAGKPYDYKVTLTGGGTAKEILWYVTTNPELVAGKTYATTGGVTAGATTYTVNSGQGTPTFNVTWAPELIANALLTTGPNYYVVVKYVTTNAEGCDIDNVAAFKILPVNMFQLDLDNVLSDGTDKTGNNVCTSPVVSAIITDDGTNATIAYNYGVTNIYVKVTAQSFTGAWNMTINRDALIAAAAGLGESAILYWGTEATGAENAATVIANNGPISIAEQNTADATTPEVIYLRLQVTHGIYDGTTAESFNFIVNGTDSAGNPDVNATCVSSDTDDQVTQTILDRAKIVNNGTTVGNLIQP